MVDCVCYTLIMTSASPNGQTVVKPVIELASSRHTFADRSETGEPQTPVVMTPPSPATPPVMMHSPHTHLNLSGQKPESTGSQANVTVTESPVTPVLQPVTPIVARSAAQDTAQALVIYESSRVRTISPQPLDASSSSFSRVEAVRPESGFTPKQWTTLGLRPRPAELLPVAIPTDEDGLGRVPSLQILCVRMVAMRVERWRNLRELPAEVSSQTKHFIVFCSAVIHALPVIS